MGKRFEQFTEGKSETYTIELAEFVENAFHEFTFMAPQICSNVLADYDVINLLQGEKYAYATVMLYPDGPQPFLLVFKRDSDSMFYLDKLLETRGV